jgi:hypothetical protein
MSCIRTFALAAVLAALVPVSAAAQSRGRVPSEGSMAAGGEVGFFLPDDEFDVSPIFAGLFEYYVTPRLGLRGSLSVTSPQFDRGTDDALRQARLGFDVIYNWERGAWHPFAGGGLGIHFLDLKENDRSIGDESELGLSLLGGAEYFFDRRTSFKFEGRFQFVGDDVFGDPSGLAATFGIKRYF